MITPTNTNTQANIKTVDQEIFQRGRYSIVPNELWKLPISDQAKILWGYIHSQSVKYNPRYTQIIEETGINRKHIRRRLDELVEHNMLDIFSGKNGSNEYVLKPMSEWKSSTHLGTTYISSTGTGTKSSTHLGTKSSTHLGTTNNTNYNTKNNTPHSIGDCPSDQHISELIKKVADALKSKQIEYDLEAIRKTLGLINHQLGWSWADIDVTLPELDLYLMGSNPRFRSSIYSEIYKWFTYYRKPAKPGKNDLPSHLTSSQRKMLQRTPPSVIPAGKEWNYTPTKAKELTPEEVERIYADIPF